ncbi:MAG: alpha/beta fold hydrolase [Deltaproteobacteria bacterium]|nr:alpha/beta fold hydrolase [Deltaproteobacteria bacterium]
MSALRIGTATYVGLLAFVAVKANDVVFPAPSSDDGPIVKGARAITARAADGHPVHALVFDPPDSRAPVVVQFHGNGEVVGWNQPLGLELKRRGFGAVLVEYRGYGKSTGVRPSEDGLYADAEAVIQWLRAAGVGPGRTVLWGFSLGTGVAAEMAARGAGSALVLQAPFTSVPDVASRVAWFLPVRTLVRERFDTLSKAARITIPTLVIHGSADPVIPFRMGEAVSRAIAGAKLVRVRGGGHDYTYGRGGWVFDEIAAFVRGGA